FTITHDLCPLLVAVVHLHPSSLLLTPSRYPPLVAGVDRSAVSLSLSLDRSPSASLVVHHRATLHLFLAGICGAKNITLIPSSTVFYHPPSLTEKLFEDQKTAKSTQERVLYKVVSRVPVSYPSS
uniref:Uncharacterized protein n=1 Tax=Cucumis melo TaxID=3656 RepID=A0A9I9CTT7_CUCME